MIKFIKMVSLITVALAAFMVYEGAPSIKISLAFAGEDLMVASKSSVIPSAQGAVQTQDQYQKAQELVIQKNDMAQLDHGCPVGASCAKLPTFRLIDITPLFKAEKYDPSIPPVHVDYEIPGINVGDEGRVTNSLDAKEWDGTISIVLTGTLTMNGGDGFSTSMRYTINTKDGSITQSGQLPGDNKTILPGSAEYKAYINSFIYHLNLAIAKSDASTAKSLEFIKFQLAAHLPTTTFAGEPVIPSFAETPGVIVDTPPDLTGDAGRPVGDVTPSVTPPDLNGDAGRPVSDDASTVGKSISVIASPVTYQPVKTEDAFFSMDDKSKKKSKRI